MEREEGLRRGRREGRGEKSIKSLVPYRSGHSGQLSVSGGDQGQKGPSCGRWVWSIGRQAGPSTPSGQDVSLGEEESPPESPFVAGRGTPSRTRNWALV